MRALILRHNHQAWISCVLLLAVLLASCSGGLTQGTDAAADGDSLAATYGEMLPLGSPLPELPADDAEVGDLLRDTSAVHEYLGADYLIASGGSVEGDSLLLQSSGDHIAWAVYKASGLQDQHPLTLAMETRPQDLDTTYYVGLGSFRDNRWHWLAESNLPEVNIDLRNNGQQFISRLGNMYWAVVVGSGKHLHVDKSTIITGDGNGGPGGDCVAEGPIEILDDLAIVVMNRYFIHNRETHWVDEHGNPSGPDAFAIGDLVRVQGREAENPVIGGGCIALLVQKLADNGGGGNGNMFALDGHVDAIDPHIMVISGPPGAPPHTIHHNSLTAFILPDGTPGGWADVHPGAFVHVVGEILADGAWLAHVVHVIDGNGGGGGGGGNITIDGSVHEVNDHKLFVAGFNNNNITAISHNPDTAWILPNGQIGSWLDASPGDHVIVDCQDTPDIGLVALHVMILGDGGGGGGGGNLSFTGIIHSINDSMFKLEDSAGMVGPSFFHDAHTAWLLPDGTPGTWEDAAVGDLVTVDAAPLPDGGLLAFHVIIHGDGNGNPGL